MIKKIIILLVVLAGIVAFGVFLKNQSPERIRPRADLKGEKILSREYSHMTGSAQAKVTVVEFADFQCPYCAQSYEPVKTVVEKYKSNPEFNFVFRHFPLSQHPNAEPAAQAAEAAGVQGKFWEMVSMIFSKQSDWSGSINAKGQFISYAQEIGVSDMNKFKQDMDAMTHINQIGQDNQDGLAWGVTGTPTFFINGEVVANYSELDQKITEALGKQ